jgi:hypothetical protein
MLNLAASALSWTEVARDIAVERLHHHPKQASRQSGVPSTFGRFIPDESVLRLNFQELAGQPLVSGSI